MGDNTIYYVIAAFAAIVVIYFLTRKKKEETIVSPSPSKKEEAVNINAVKPLNTADVISDTENEIAAAIAVALHCYEEDKQKDKLTLLGSAMAPVLERHRKRESNWARTARYESHKKL